MAGKYSTKPVKRNDPSLNLEGGSPGRTFTAPKYEQLNIPGLRLAKLKKSTNSVNET